MVIGSENVIPFPLKLDWETILHARTAWVCCTYAAVYTNNNKMMKPYRSYNIVNSNPFAYLHDVRPEIHEILRGRHITWCSTGCYSSPARVLCSKWNIMFIALFTNIHSFELLIFNLRTALFIYPIKVRVYTPQFNAKKKKIYKTQIRLFSHRRIILYCTLYGVIRLTREAFSLFQKALKFLKIVRVGTNF